MKSALLIVFFPLIIPLWEKIPLDSKNTAVPSSLYFMEDNDILQAKGYFSKVQDSRIRSNLVNDLADANNKRAVAVLEELLYNEKSLSVRDNILKNLSLYGKNARLLKPARLKEFFTSPSPTVRRFAALLYLANTHDSAPLLGMLAGEKSIFVKNSLWDALFNDPGKLDILRCSSFLESAFPSDRAGAAKLIAARSSSPDSVPALLKAVSDKAVSVRYSIAEGLKAGPVSSVKIPELLAVDKNPSVRAAVAALSVSPEREKIFIRLAGDTDSEVRRIACITLGGYSDDAGIESLLKRFSDSSGPVRAAAEDAIINIVPGEKHISEIESMLNDRAARNSAIRVLGSLVAKGAAPAISEILAEKGISFETQARAITALGQLSYTPAALDIAKKASSSDSGVRRAVAASLGRLRVKETDDTLIKLSSDKDNATSLRAVISMGRIGDIYFEDTLFKIISDVGTSNTPEMRAAGCWALASINSTDDRVLAQLRTLHQKKVIAMEMEKVYDSDYVRASAILALIKMGRADNPAAKDLAVKTIDYYYTNPFLREGDNTPAMDDYMRQICLYYKDMEINPEIIESVRPQMSVSKYPPEKEVRKKKTVEPPVDVKEK
ncbi:MAG: hypothetical protein A2020_03480 [Lentisphaerae bacterium GWF2_45_14]|nr:MAG: hypothetical protein A2020_03480 [Lentisphaerae bacterium GWF2_45_14]